MSKRDNKRFNDKERSTAPKRGGKNRRDYGDDYTYEPKKRGAASSRTDGSFSKSGSRKVDGSKSGRSQARDGYAADRPASNRKGGASAGGRDTSGKAPAKGKSAGSRASGRRSAGRASGGSGFREKRDFEVKRSLMADFGYDEVFENEFQNPVGADGLEVVAGRNPVTEALTGDRDVERVFIADGAEGSVSKIVAIAREQGIIVDFVPKERIDAMAPGVKHQGVVAKVSEYKYADMEDVFARAEGSGEDPFIIILDEISDPHNLGAIIRTAECAGAHGVIIPKRRAASLTQTAALASAGAVENMPVVQVTNLARAIEDLQARGVWVGAADMDGQTYYEANLTGPIAIVIGNEGKGVGRLVKEKCDFVLSVPMHGKINSLNASNAAAILMYGIRRARDQER